MGSPVHGVSGAWEWPVATASVSALVAGGWGSALRPGRDLGGRQVPAGRCRVSTRSAYCLVLLLSTGCSLHHAPVVHPPPVSCFRPSAHPRWTTARTASRRSQGARQSAADRLRDVGDRGWAGKDLDVIGHLVSWGYRVAASTPTTTSGTSTATRRSTSHVTGGFGHHDARASGTELSPRSSPPLTTGWTLAECEDVLLVGVSRGAGLSIMAARASEAWGNNSRGSSPLR